MQKYLVGAHSIELEHMWAMNSRICAWIWEGKSFEYALLQPDRADMNRLSSAPRDKAGDDEMGSRHQRHGASSASRTS